MRAARAFAVFVGVVEAALLQDDAARASVAAATLQCDAEIAGPICLGGREEALLAPALQEGLVGYWSFDGSLPLDASGNGYHGAGRVKAGPSQGGRGSSALFQGTVLKVPSAAALDLRDFSYTFWLYLVEDGPTRAATASQLCPLVRKGLDSGAHFPSEEYGRRSAASPAVLFDSRTRRLHVELATLRDGDCADSASGSAGACAKAELEVFESNARLGKGRWFHVALVRLDGERRTRLYVNGILDSSQGTQGHLRPNQEPLYVGSGDPVSQGRCGDLPFYMDELRAYDRPLEPDEIEAEAASALAGVEPAFVRLACTACPLEEALQNCPQGYHLCDSLEMHMGGYQVARTLGWLEHGGRVWSRSSPAAAAGPAADAALASPASAPAQGAALLGLGLCCATAGADA